LRFIRKLRNKQDLQVTTVTNLLALDRYSEHDLEFIVRSLNIIMVSIGPNRSVYKQMFGVDGFERVLSNMMKLSELSNKYNDSAEIRIAGRGGGEDFSIDPLLTEVCESVTDIDDIEWYRSYNNWGSAYNVPDLPLNTPVIRNELPDYSIVPCYYILSPHIDDDGLVFACSCAGMTDDFIIGDLKRESLKDVLLSERRKEIIDSFIDGTYPENCKRCSFYLPDRSIPWHLFSQEVCETEEPTPKSFGDYNYAKHRHFDVLARYADDLYPYTISPEECSLKVYQDLLVYAFIRNTIPPGSRILEVGGGNSRVLARLHDEYECWNIDKFEGLGNGPTRAEGVPYTLVSAYMGEFSRELPNDYFDFVFSISALEHVDPSDPELHGNIIRDIHRVLARGGYSLHCFDIIVAARLERGYYDYIFHGLSLETAPGEDRFRNFKALNIRSKWNYIPGMINGFFEVPESLSSMPVEEELSFASDVWAMSESAFNKNWKSIVKRDYGVVGYPTSVNALWKRVE
jgi:radical SAM protein with 4Fe4S-binding SPASM domain